MPRVPLTAAEYFAGIGLVRLGLERAGWRVVFANDFDPQKYEMYVSYFKDAAEHYALQDIFTLDPQSIPKTTLATSSFPCIDLSLAGNLNGLSGKHSSAFWGFIRILREQGSNRPPLVMLENVPGWLTSNRGEDFRVTIQALNDLGYACDVYAIDALRFTPQSRVRIFVVGVQTDEPNRDIYNMLRRSGALTTTALRRAIMSHPRLLWHALNAPEPPPLRMGGLRDEIIEDMPDDDPRWWDANEVQRHLDMMTDSHRKRVEELKNQPIVHYRTIFRRRRDRQRAEVRRGDTAGCLRTARGGSSRQIVVAAGRGQIKMRHMTPREYARLQGVPDDYPLPPNTIQALTGFGDAVCAPVITWLAENVLTPLAAQLSPEANP
ncbi:MAG: DNA (cytosine-5-)-methyltransferase [Chloroflexi bacterium]|nr:DNA (cytosine-5-)-methyltransferase [Chloroflexota bacterium]